MIGRLLLRVILVAVLVAVMPGAVWAQNPPSASQDTTELSFEREVFSYPQYARRNPFAPLLSAEGGGPRFERLILLGILYAPDGENSLALFGEGTRTTVSETEITVEVTGATIAFESGRPWGTRRSGRSNVARWWWRWRSSDSPKRESSNCRTAPRAKEALNEFHSGCTDWCALGGR